LFENMGFEEIIINLYYPLNVKGRSELNEQW
jgi:hypothetical protein